MQSFAISLCLAILEKFLVKGSLAFHNYLALKYELEQNTKKAQEYNKVVNDKTKTREERKDAENSALS